MQARRGARGHEGSHTREGPQPAIDLGEVGIGFDEVPYPGFGLGDAAIEQGNEAADVGAALDVCGLLERRCPCLLRAIRPIRLAQLALDVAMPRRVEHRDHGSTDVST